MSARCSASGCCNSVGQCSMFTFPLDADLYMKWKVNTNRATGPCQCHLSQKSTKYSRLCQDHFTDECFVFSPKLANHHGIKVGKLRLKKNAVPTLFTSTVSKDIYRAFEKRQRQKTWEKMSGSEDGEVFCRSLEDHNDNLMKILREQFVNGRNCNLEIRLRDANFCVHKFLVDAFFTKIKADIENDMFYIDMKEFTQTMVKPLIDMMYHGSLTVPYKNILDVQRTSSYVGFTQAEDLMNQLADTLTPKDGCNSKYLPTCTSTEENSIIIKSESPNEVVGDSGLINAPGNIADNMSTETSKDKSWNLVELEEPKNIYEVFTPNPNSLDNNVSEVTSTLKFKENIGYSDLIRDKNKTSVIVTHNPPALGNKRNTINYNLTENYPKRSVGVSVMHVNSPGLKANRSTYDGTNTKNSVEAAANCMLENSTVLMPDSKAKRKSTPHGEINELKTKACVKGKQSGADTNTEKFIGNTEIKQEKGDPTYSGSEPMEKKVHVYATRKRSAPAASTYAEQSDDSDHDNSDALSSFSKSKKITEPITDIKGDGTVINKEISKPVRRTMFKPNEPGVAAVVVCHPTKPIVRY